MGTEIQSLGLYHRMKSSNLQSGFAALNAWPERKLCIFSKDLAFYGLLNITLLHCRIIKWMSASTTQCAKVQY